MKQARKNMEEKGDMTYWQFETLIISDIIEQYPKYREKLKHQLETAVIAKRDIMKYGFFTKFIIENTEATLGDGVDLMLGQNQWMINGLAQGSDYILWVRNGMITALEGFSYGEPWPHEITFCVKMTK